MNSSLIPPKVGYIEPFMNSLKRMIKTLFNPFEIQKWFIIGFSAWISSMCEYSHPPYPMGFQLKDESLFHNFKKFFQYFLQNPFDLNIKTFFVISVGIIFFIAFVIIIWINSRGKFIFLQNLIKDDLQIISNWKKFAICGNSFFRWRIGLYSIVVLSLAILGAIAVSSALPYFKGKQFFVLMVTGLAVSLFLLLITSIFFICVDILLKDFIAPLMFKYSIPASDAWKMFFPVLKDNWDKFVIYVLFLIPLNLVIGFIVSLIVIFTCCVAGCLLSIPYIGSVLFLPVSVTRRFLGPEFLAQFGKEVNIFNTEEKIEGAG